MPLIRRGGVSSPTPSGPEDDDALAALATGTSEQRWAAARALPVSERTRDALSAALLAETDIQVREAIFTALLRAASPTSVAVVLPLLRSDDAGIRTGALDVLRALPQHTLPHLAGLLADDDPDVRILSCKLARMQPQPDAVHLLSNLVASETDANVCGAAIDVLADLAGPEILPLLARCAARFAADPFLRFSIEVASRRLGAETNGRRG